MKETYIRPELEILKFEMEDVITTSGDINDLTGEAANGIDGWTPDFY